MVGHYVALWQPQEQLSVASYMSYFLRSPDMWYSIFPTRSCFRYCCTKPTKPMISTVFAGCVIETHPLLQSAHPYCGIDSPGQGKAQRFTGQAQSCALIHGPLTTCHLICPREIQVAPMYSSLPTFGNSWQEVCHLDLWIACTDHTHLIEWLV